MSTAFGARLAAWRRSLGLTQAALAERSGLSQAAISAIEAGRRDISLGTLARLAAALGASPGRILDDEPGGKALSRQDMDAVARAVITGKRNAAPALRRLADAMAVAMRPTLEACSLPGAVRARRRGEPAFRKAVQVYGREQVEAILERTDRFAGAMAR